MVGIVEEDCFPHADVCAGVAWVVWQGVEAVAGEVMVEVACVVVQVVVVEVVVGPLKWIFWLYFCVEVVAIWFANETTFWRWLRLLRMERLSNDAFLGCVVEIAVDHARCLGWL